MGEDRYQMTVVYPKNTVRERESLWLELTRLGQSMNEPWLIVGDMNTTMKHEERMRNGVAIGGIIESFRNLVLLL